MLAQRDENTKQKSQKITETGQMLMTIENLFIKCSNMKDIFPSTKNLKDHEKIRNFDNTASSGEKAALQLEVIIQCMDNFKKLRKQYLERKKEKEAQGDIQKKLAKK